MYKIIVNLLNDHYRPELLDIDEVKQGKFVVRQDPDTDEYGIIFIWQNDFGINEQEMGMGEMGDIIREEVMPVTIRMDREVRGIKDMIEPDNKEWLLDMQSMHEFKEENFDSIMKDGEFY